MSNCSAKFKVKNWRIDDDGLMRIKLRMLKEGVFDYGKSELGGLAGGEDGIVKVYIPASEFTNEALKSAEGKQVVINNHEWRNSSNSFSDGFSVGQLAGSPTIEKSDGNIYIECDAVIADRETVDKIKDKELCEISAGYKADFVHKPGTFNGEDYEFVQQNIVFNHVLLLPYGDGRCGVDVKILNRSKSKMSYTVKTKIGNSTHTLRFGNEEDARAAESAIEEIAKNCDSVQNELVEKTEKFEKIESENCELKAENEKLKAENEELKAVNERLDAIEEKVNEVEAKNCELEAENEKLKAENEELKAKNEELESDEHLEEMAEEMAAQKADEEAIIENEFDEAEKEEIKEEIKAGNRATRIEKIAIRALNKRGVDATEWDTARLVGAFQTMAAEIRNNVGNKKSVAGAGVMTKNSSTVPAKDRMFAHFPAKK